MNRAHTRAKWVMDTARLNVKFFQRGLLYVLLSVLALTMIYPYVWSVTASFKTDRQIYSGNPLDLIPRPFILTNYIDAWTMLPFGRFLLNSMFLSTIVPLLSISLSSLAAYAFARLKFKGRDVLFLALLGVMMLPGHITLIPKYVLMRYLGWINSYLALLIPPVFGAGIVFNTFFMRQYFLSFPKELEDAAVIDGCSRLGLFLRIIIPNSKPALATVAIISFKNEWNAFLWPLVVINDYLKMPIQVGLSYFQSNVATSWGTLLAGAMLAILPLVLVFLAFQRYFVSGMLTSGLAGK
ncbi:MAG: carbohydrate ABC transporter permease [Chloroflexota bacterium]